MYLSLYFKSYIVALRTKITALAVGLAAKDFHVKDLDFTEAVDAGFKVKKLIESEISTSPLDKWSILFYARGPLRNPIAHTGRAREVRTGTTGVQGTVREQRPGTFPVQVRFVTNSRIFADTIAQWHFVDGSSLMNVDASILLDGNAYNYKLGLMYEPDLIQEDNIEQVGETGRLHMVGWDVNLTGIVYSPLSKEVVTVDKVILSLFERNTPWTEDEVFKDKLIATLEK